MAKKRGSRKKSWLSGIISTVLLLTSGGGLSGYLNPDFPIVGPFLQSLSSQQTANSSTPTRGADRLLRTLTDVATQATQNSQSTTPAGASGGASIQLTSASRTNDKLRIASFNIQILGQSKMEKAWVVDVLAHVVRQFDIVAIQEIRAKADDIMPRFVDAVNADGSRYDFLIGPRLGRSNSTEQYAFVYDTNRVEHDPSSVATMADPTDLLHREPFLARFRVRTQAPDRAFTFWLVNIHTDPDEVEEEVSVLADAFQIMRSLLPDEDDVILLGDLNASETELGRLGQIPGITWAITGTTTNTRHTKAYDNLVFHREATGEYTGRWGVFDLESQFRLTQAQALEVSDHLPVWAEFDIWEAVPQYQTADRLPRFQRY